MKRFIAHLLYLILVRHVARRRRPNEIITTPERPQEPYLLRWWLLRYPEQDEIDKATGWRRRFLQWRKQNGYCLYLHCFLRSDDDRAHHDHPWDWTSFLLHGRYREHRNEDCVALEDFDWNGASALEVHDKRRHYDELVQVIRDYGAGSLRSSRAEDAHRVELYPAQTFRDRLPEFAWMTDMDSWFMRGRPIQELMAPAWSLFATGPWKRRWGFHCKNGWVFWRDYHAQGGCGEAQ